MLYFVYSYYNCYYDIIISGGEGGGGRGEWNSSKPLSSHHILLYETLFSVTRHVRTEHGTLHQGISCYRNSIAKLKPLQTNCSPWEADLFTVYYSSVHYCTLLWDVFGECD